MVCGRKCHAAYPDFKDEGKGSGGIGIRKRKFGWIDKLQIQFSPNLNCRVSLSLSLTKFQSEALVRLQSRSPMGISQESKDSVGL